MKKKLLLALASAAIIAGIAVIAVLGGNRNMEAHADDTHVHCVCGENLTDEAMEASGHVCSDVEWTAWDGTLTSTVKAGGYYYLTQDVTWSGQLTMSKNGADLYICLNGHTITRSKSVDSGKDSLKFFLLAETVASLNICDCQGTGHFAYTAGQAHQKDMSFLQTRTAGNVVNFYGGIVDKCTINNDADACGAIKLTSGITFNMYGGTIYGADHYKMDGTTPAGYGSAVECSDGSTFNMYGGTIRDGLAGQGSNVRVRGTMNMYGGLITGGTATGSGGNMDMFALSTTNRTHVFNMYGGTISNGTAQNGGNIKAVGYSGNNASSIEEDGNVLNIYGGTISGGVANGTTSGNGFGGNLYLAGAKSGSYPVGTVVCTIGEDAIIEDGTGKYGGNIALRGYAGSLKDKVTMNGGIIRNGYASVRGGNVSSEYGSNNALFKMLGGEISGGRTAGYGGNVSTYLTGQFIMEGGVVKNGLVESDSFSGSATIVDKKPTAATNDDKGFGGNIGALGNSIVVIAGGEVSGGVCKCTGTGLVFGGNIGAASNVNSELKVNVGYVYILGGVIKNGLIENRATKSPYSLCCYGANVAAGGPCSYYADGQVYLYVYGGTITQDVEDGAAHTSYGAYNYSADTNTTAYGGNIYSNYSPRIKANTSVTVSGTTYPGGPVVIGNGYVYSQNGSGYGGNIAANNSSLVIEGATIQNGRASTRGGNIHYMSNVTGNTLVNATVSGGTADGTGGSDGGGNINVQNGTLTITNSVISDGYGYKGGNILTAQSASAKVVMQSGTITRGFAKNSGGNVFLSGVFEMNDGEISYGGSNGNGGNVFVNISNDTGNYGIFTLNDGEIFNGYTENATSKKPDKGGLNFNVNGTSSSTAYNAAKLFINGGSIYFTDDTYTTTKGDTFHYGDAMASGANIRSNGYIEMNGGVISGGHAIPGTSTKDGVTTLSDTYGGCILLLTAQSGLAESKKNKLIINGGIIENGTAFTQGGLIYVNAYDEVTITGDAILRNGTTETSTGSNVYAGSNSVVTISGGTFYEGVQLFGKDESVTYYGITKTTSGDKSAQNFILGGLFTVSGGNFLAPSGKNGIYVNASSKAASTITGGYFDRVFVQVNSSSTFANNKSGSTVYTPFISGGFFNSIGNQGYIVAPNLYCDLDPDEVLTVGGEDYTFKYEVAPGRVVSVSSFATDAEGAKTGSGVATVSGGGKVRATDTRTLTAQEAEGFTFVGWATAASTDATTYTLITGATELTYTAPAGTEDALYVAIYKVNEVLIAYSVTGEGVVVTIDGEEAAKTGEVKAGTKLTVSYDGTDFANYANESSKIVSTDAEYTTEVYTETILLLNVKAQDANATQLVFLNERLQVSCVINATAALTTLPDVPVRLNRTGGTWDKTLDELNAVIADPSVTYYEINLGGYTWTTEESTLYDDTNIKDAVEPAIEITTAISTKQTQQKNGVDVYTLSIVASRKVPEGFTMIEQGILFTTSAKVANATEAEAILVNGNAAATKYRSASSETEDYTALNAKNAPADVVLYAKGYLVYLDSENELHTIYTDLTELPATSR